MPKSKKRKPKKSTGVRLLAGRGVTPGYRVREAPDATAQRARDAAPAESPLMGIYLDAWHILMGGAPANACPGLPDVAGVAAENGRPRRNDDSRYGRDCPDFG